MSMIFLTLLAGLALGFLGGGLQPVAVTGAVEVPSRAYGRVLEGLELYLQCKRVAKACVDPSDLVLESRSLNTWQNAQYCAAWLDVHPEDQVVLVTSGFHLRRANLYFSHFGIRALPVRADFVSPLLSPVPQAHSFLLLDLALHEYAGLWRYGIYEMLGWNGAPRLPHSH